MSLTKRLSVPIGVTAIVAMIVAFGPSLLANARPSLPQLSAKQLLANMQRSDVEGLSGVVDMRSQLGLPQLPGSSSAPGGSPHGNGVAPRDLLTGDHTLRVATAGPDKQRVELLGELSQYTFVRNGSDAWAYDSSKNEAIRWQLPDRARGSASDRQSKTGADSMTPQALAQRFLDKVDPSTRVNVSGTDTVAGRDVYTLSLAPRSSNSLVGQAEIFVDAQQWIPLKVKVTPRGGGEPALDVGFREVSFGAPPASRFNFTPPEGAKVKQQDPGQHGDRARSQQAPQQHASPQRLAGDHPEVIGQDWTTVLRVDNVPAGQYKGLLARSGERVSGEFGNGQLVTSRLVTALLTEDGQLYVGAVTPSAIQEAAAK